MKMRLSSPLFQALIYACVYYAVFSIARSEKNYVYGYIAAWCIGLWISSLLNIKVKTAVFVIILFTSVNITDVMANLFYLNPSKQEIDTWIIIKATVNAAPIAINHIAHRLISQINI